MPRQEMTEVAKSLRGLLKEKQAVEAKEKALLTDLSAVLRSMGYQLAPVNSTRPSNRPRARSAGRASTPAPKRTRKPMGPAARKAVARRMKAYWAKRRKATAKGGK